MTNYYGLFPLISTMGLYGRRTPLKVFGPKPLDEILEAHFKYFDTELPYEVQFCEVNTRAEKVVFETSYMTVETIPLRHRVPCCGYLFREKEPELNIEKSAIERYGLGIAQIAAAKRGEDLTLEDGTLLPASEITYRPFRPRAYAYCSDTQYSAKVASMAEVGRLLIGHFSARYKDERVLLNEARTLFEATDLATEGRTFEIPKRRE